MLKDEPLYIKNFTELFSIFNFLLDISNDLTVRVLWEPSVLYQDCLIQTRLTNQLFQSL